MHTLTVITIGVLGCLLGLILSYSSIKEIVRIRHTPSSHIGALQLKGQAEVVGKADNMAVNSPLTQKACVLWHVEIQEKR